MRFLLLILVFSNIFFSGLAQKSDKDKLSVSTRDEIIPGYFIFDFGVSTLIDAPEPMDLRVWGSWSVNFSYTANVDLSRSVKFLPGIGLSVDNYKFQSDVSLFRGENILGEGRVQFYELPYDEVRKTKFSVTYLDIPLELHFTPSPTRSKFHFAVGGKVGLPVSAATKVKYRQNDTNFIDKTKNNFFVSPVRYGALARIGYGSFYVFGYYGFNTLFQEDRLDCDCGGGTPLTIGVTLAAF